VRQAFADTPVGIDIALRIPIIFPENSLKMG
jgi:hypothetical protein